ncbi:unnamed protein product [Rhodiola kirilowii]
MTVDHTDDCYYPYKQPGSVPFKWEIRPGVPKLHHNPKPSPPTISTTRRVVSSSPQPKLKPPPAKNSSYPQEDRPIRSFRSDPRTRSALSSPRIHSERRLAGPEVVAPGCFPSPSKRVQSSRIWVFLRPSSMTVAEMQIQLDEVRRQSEDQNQALKNELASIRDLLQGLLSQRQSPMDPSSSNNPTTSTTGASPPPTPTTNPPHLNDMGHLSTVRHPPDPPDIQRAPLLPGGLATRISKVEFPKFDGTLLREWIYRCEQFFLLDSTPPELKVRLASLHMEGKALQWHHNFMSSRFDQFPSWPEYIVAISTRFGSLLDDPLADLVSLKQGADHVEEYLDKFECALTRLTLPIHHALSIFLTNMHPHLALHVRQFNVSTVAEAARIARLHESSLQHSPQKFSRAPFNPYTKPYIQTPTLKPSSTALLPSPHITKQAQPLQPFNSANPIRPTNDKPPRRYSYEEMQERRLKGLCMFCEEPYSPGHHFKHKRSQIYVIEGDDDIDDIPVAENFMQAAADEQPVACTDDSPTISVNALNGSTTFNCMRIIGQCGKRKLFILIDPGSTHNFIDVAVAKDIGCLLEHVSPMPVAAANGNQMLSAYKCDNFSWTMQGYKFVAAVRTLPLDCCDLVLGVQWLITLGRILWDFSNLRMEFTLGGIKHVLRGVTKVHCKVIKGCSLNKLISQNPQLALLHLIDLSDDTYNCFSHTPSSGLSYISMPDSNKEQDADLQHLLYAYSDIFADPNELPPLRDGFNHHIPLIEGAKPVNQRPYRYSTLQKNAIEKLIQDMLTQGLIQYSSSPYAAPVVLVKKKDGSWRLCVDYRGLNKQTVKDKYPIPLLEDLLDELGGSCYFSKLDLRAGFHQIRMAPQDIYKTAFKTHSGHYEYLVMPFGLTNAPCTFQGLMNHIFRDIARKFLLVFFDDILVYSSSWADHLQHLQSVFCILRQNKLYLKLSKCTFGACLIEYLGHFISAEGVRTDPKKIAAIQNWPVPANQQQLRSFLGLANYYRRFIKNYSIIASPLTNLLRKDNFSWNSETSQAFQNLKDALSTSPVLALPDFTKQFIVETDASSQGIGAVLMQDHHPICYISRKLGPRHQSLSVYEKELLAVIHAVQTWSSYLTHSTFIIKTDQRSLKYLLEQKITTPFQHMWLSKLMGYSFEIHYKQGKENHAADALSRIPDSHLLSTILSQAHQGFYDSIKLLWHSDPMLSKLITEIQANPATHPKFTFTDGELRHRGKLVIGNDSNVKLQIFRWLHDSAIGGHSGRDATLYRVKSLFYWPGMSKEVHNYVRNCTICQKNKYDLSAKPGLLQPLPIPDGIWQSVSLDFIEGLPPSFRKHCILVVIDRFSKNAHFMALSHPYTAIEVAQVYLDNVFKLHGMPLSIVSDRDPTFLSQVWQELFRVHGVDLKFSTAYHPQTDGQTEVTNKTLETYLRCMTSDTPHTWSKWLPLAEWWYNTTSHTATKTTPYEIIYGQPPPMHLPYLPGESSCAAVDQSLRKREEMIALLKFHLQRAQNRMKQYADRHRSSREFNIGDYVYLKLQPYKQQSLKTNAPHKLSPRFYGPFRIIDRIGAVAYKLELPPEAAIHNVFHVSQLKLCPNPPSTSPTLPQYLLDHGQQKEPEAILDRKVVKRHNKDVTKVLVQWKGYPMEQATWELYTDFISKHPSFFILEAKDAVDRGVM